MIEQDQTSEDGYLTPYHQQRNKDLLEAAQREPKRRLSREEFRKQVAQLKEEAKTFAPKKEAAKKPAKKAVKKKK